MDDLIVMGEAMSACTNNLELADVRTVVESTGARLKDPNSKITGGPALAKLLGDNGSKVDAWEALFESYPADVSAIDKAAEIADPNDPAVTLRDALVVAACSGRFWNGSERGLVVAAE